MKNKSMISLLLVLVLLVGLISSCGKKHKDKAGERTDETVGEVQYKSPVDDDSIKAPESKDQLVVVVAGDARSIDPHGAGDSASVTALSPVMETLVKMNSEGGIEPNLAESWERVDEKTWKFKLREGVKFHNGETMTANDVIYSFKRALSPKGARVQYIMNIIDPEGMEAINDYELIVRTTVPFTPFVDYLPYIGAAIISEKAYTEDPDAENHPVGTGSYKFKKWNKGSSLEYERFDDYWGDKEDCKSLLMKVIPEANSRMIELETGNADIAINMTVNDLQRIDDNENLDLVTTPSTVFTQLSFNNRKAPFDNQKFRQALDYAIDQESIVKAVHRGSAIFTPGPITPGQLYYDDSEPHDRYDPEKAKQLLEELKQEGLDFSREFRITTNDNQVRVDIATIILKQLKEVGINAKIERMETAAFFDYVESEDKDMIISGWGAVGFKDPDNNLYGPHATEMIPSNNHCFYSNPKVDELLAKTRLVENGEEREKACKEIQQIIRNDAPYLTFDNPIYIIGKQKYVKGFHGLPTAHQFFNGIKIH